MNTPLRWFARTFGLAVVAHLAANPAGWRGDATGGSAALVITSALLGMLSLALMARPSRRLMAATATLVLVSLWFELPVTGNHWLLMGFISLAVLASRWSGNQWGWLSVTGRWILLAFYSFAAFAKLNAGFLDRETSCGVFYANQSLASFGLPTFAGDSYWGTLAIAGPVLTELSVPVLLAFTRTRRAGVLLALTFHSIISLDFDQHFYDFTAVLVMLLCLFLPEATLTDLEERVSRPSRIRSFAFVVGCAAVVASVLPPSLPTVVVLRLIVFATWVPLVLWLIFRVARAGLGPSSVPMRLRGVAAWTLVLLVLGNGLTPYLELKTGTGWNMYANLVTVAGESNHIVVPGTLHLSGVQDDLLRVVETNDKELRLYADDGYLIPERNLLDYLGRHPSVTVTVTGKGGERTLEGADGARVSVLVEKFQAFRAVDEQDPPRCQARWLPAR
jgi:hypothetical protein